MCLGEVLNDPCHLNIHQLVSVVVSCQDHDQELLLLKAHWFRILFNFDVDCFHIISLGSTFVYVWGQFHDFNCGAIWVLQYTWFWFVSSYCWELQANEERSICVFSLSLYLSLLNLRLCEQQKLGCDSWSSLVLYGTGLLSIFLHASFN